MVVSEIDVYKRQDYKRTGGRLVGYLCSYTPLEVIDAAGAAAVGLCGTSPETIPAAEAVLPANLCPLVKSTYGFALSDKCPFTYFSDLIVGETTCEDVYKRQAHRPGARRARARRRRVPRACAAWGWLSLIHI